MSQVAMFQRFGTAGIGFVVNSLLSPVLNRGYELHFVETKWRFSTGLTADANITASAAYGVVPAEGEELAERVLDHTVEFHSPTAAAVELIPHSFVQHTPFPPGLLVPQWVIRAGSGGQDGFLELLVTVCYTITLLSDRQMLDVNRRWSADVDQPHVQMMASI